jgi:hypothetical protein
MGAILPDGSNENWDLQDEEEINKSDQDSRSYCHLDIGIV